MNDAILIEADDWEGLFVNGKLVDEGHTLNEGMSRTKYFINLSEKYNFKLKEMKEKYIDEKDEDELYRIGCFPNSLDQLKGKYL